MIFKSVSAIVGLGFLAMSSAQAANVTLTPAASTVNPGDSVTINVNGWSFDTAAASATLGVAFDPAVLTLDKATLSAGSPFDLVDLDFGNVTLYKLALPDVRDDFPAFDLHFTAQAMGSTSVSLVDEETTLLGWFDSFAEPIPGILYDQASVQVVPLPAAVWMMLGGMGLLGWVARRRA